MFFSSILLIMAAAVAQQKPESTDPLDKERCIREDVTGSLITKRKVCHTEREWRQIRGDAESEARRINQPGNLNGQGT
jgi:hypothetical protein